MKMFAGVELFHFDLNALYAIPIIVFGFNCHANVGNLVALPVFNGNDCIAELEELKHVSVMIK